VKKGGVVHFALVSDHMRICAGRRDQVVMADELADPRPRHPAQVEQRDAAVTQVVR
jgi:hypothetical protein